MKPHDTESATKTPKHDIAGGVVFSCFHGKRTATLSCAARVCAVAALVIAVLLTGPGCSSKKKGVGLNVDLYLHPSSADPTDVILEAGIGKRLDASSVARNASIHVRVVDGVVTLSGAVASDPDKAEAERIARETELTLNGTAIRPAGAIKNQLDVVR